MDRRLIILLTFSSVIDMTAGSACAKDRKTDTDQIGSRDVGKGVNFYSISKEMALGKQMARDIELQVRTIDDPNLTNFINRVGQNIVRNSDAKIPFTIKLLDSEDVNALALPGGYLFVNSGLILKTNSESELASVLAHEIAHVAARHWTKQATRDEILNLASIPLIFMGGWAGYAIRQGMGLAAPLTSLHFSRSFEREADFLGLQYLYKAGYDPISFVDFFERIQSAEKKKRSPLTKLLTTHPMTLSRIKAAQSEMKTLAVKPEFLVNTSEFDEVRTRLQMLYDRRKAETDRYSNRPLLRRAPASKPADREQ